MFRRKNVDVHCEGAFCTQHIWNIIYNLHPSSGSLNTLNWGFFCLVISSNFIILTSSSGCERAEKDVKSAELEPSKQSRSQKRKSNLIMWACCLRCVQERERCSYRGNPTGGETCTQKRAKNIHHKRRLRWNIKISFEYLSIFSSFRCSLVLFYFPIYLFRSFVTFSRRQTQTTHRVEPLQIKNEIHLTILSALRWCWLEADITKARNSLKEKFKPISSERKKRKFLRCCLRKRNTTNSNKLHLLRLSELHRSWFSRFAAESSVSLISHIKR